ncbi:hypothetical protein PoB_002543000 [Plakobranchus ocellatus]|uniref:Uncharacterized protein n=1 Tax=Plakobranchus ocellatus TaxID=259542 RepID=A0AAV3ZUU1_9GAST|nr:hypothetical protein PoB_002543000 [Plakobranchus ocellatus]
MLLDGSGTLPVSSSQGVLHCVFSDQTCGRRECSPSPPGDFDLPLYLLLVHLIPYQLPRWEAPVSRADVHRTQLKRKWVMAVGRDSFSRGEQQQFVET